MPSEAPLDRAVAFIEWLTIDPWLMGDDIEMLPDDIRRHAKVELASIRTALAAAEGWQPIETAPKDGRSVLCFVPLDTMGVPFNHRVLALRYEARKSAWLTDVYAFVPFEPTHWRPLPLPPAPGKGTGNE